MRRLFIKAAIAALSVAGIAAAPVQAQDKTIRIAYIDPVSGMMAPVGAHGLKELQFFAEAMNKKAGANGVKFEIIPFDNKLSPQESLNVLKVAIDRGIRYVTQGNGSGVALALQDAIEKHNERNPDKSVMFLNYAAVDPDMTNQKCSFWHFRFDANSDMKMEALTTWMAKEPKIKNVYLFNQNYAFGVAVDRAAKEYLARKRPDVKIVGTDLHPLAQVKDFAPYVAKIKASGADSVITGNWGNDFTLLMKAAKDANLNVNFYGYYPGVIGTPTAIASLGDAAIGKITQISYWHTNVGPKNELTKMSEEFAAKYKEDMYTLAFYNMLQMLSKAANDTKSIDPLKVARAMEGMKIQTPMGEVEMRKTDHQLQQPIYLSSWQKVDGKADGKGTRYASENTGYGFRADVTLDNFVAAQPTTCQMKRP